MNKQLLVHYNKLSTKERKSVLVKFDESPKAKRLLSFLESYEGTNFKSREAVKDIYIDDLVTTKFEKLQNRYFKLRKKVLAELSTEQKNISQIAELPDEERQLHYCLELIRNNEHSIAVKELQTLINKCLYKNIFELLPDLYFQLEYCFQVLNQHDESQKIFEDHHKAIELEKNFRSQQLLSKQAYHFCVTKGFKNARSYLYKMKEISHQNKDYPRFSLNYHFASFSLGMISWGNKLHASSRHYNHIKKIRGENPEMPILNYDSGYLFTSEYYLLISQASYEYFKGDIEKSYECIKRSWEILSNNPNLSIKKSENHYRNKMHIEVAAEKFEEAIKTCEELLEYQREQGIFENQLLAYAELAQIYIHAWPKKLYDNPDLLLENIDKYIFKLKRKDPQRLLGEIYALKASLLFLKGEYEDAVSTYKVKSCTTLCSSLGLELYEDLFKLPLDKTQDKINTLQTKIQKKLFKQQTHKIEGELKWILRMVQIIEFSTR